MSKEKQGIILMGTAGGNARVLFWRHATIRDTNVETSLVKRNNSRMKTQKDV